MKINITFNFLNILRLICPIIILIKIIMMYCTLEDTISKHLSWPEFLVALAIGLMVFFAKHEKIPYLLELVWAFVFLIIDVVQIIMILIHDRGLSSMWVGLIVVLVWVITLIMDYLKYRSTREQNTTTDSLMRSAPKSTSGKVKSKTKTTTKTATTEEPKEEGGGAKEGGEEPEKEKDKDVEKGDAA